MLEENAENFSKSPAIIDCRTNSMMAYHELWEKIDAVAGKLISLGIGKGDRVALYLPNGSEFIISYFAILKIGAIVVPLNILYKGPEIQYMLENSRVKALIGANNEISENLIPIRSALSNLQLLIGWGNKQEQYIDVWFSDCLSSELHTETVQVEDNYPAAILYTSGTTGRPKGAILSHINIAVNAKLNGHYLLCLNDSDISLGLSPYNHVFFIQIVLGPLAVGSSVVTLPRSSPEMALKAIEKYKVTHLSAVPTIFRYILKLYSEKTYDLSSWRVAGSAAASISAELVNELERTFNVDFFEAYGATEISSTATYTRLRHPKPGSIGRPLHGYRVKLLDSYEEEVPIGEVGEFVVKGPGVFQGYWELPEDTKNAFTSDGWYKTGDLARQDEEGYLYIVDRKKDMIVSGGYNIYPRELEEILITHPALADVTVIGESDINLGEIPVAFVIPKKDIDVSPEDILAFCSERMAKYKIPRLIQFVEEFPRTGSGKVLKRLLRNNKAS